MPVKFELSVMQVGISLRMTIPKEIAAHLKIKKGDTVQLWVDNQHMIVEKKTCGKRSKNKSKRKRRSR